MNVAVIGSGGREHAIADKISESRLLSDLFIIPGNPGTANLGKNISLNVSDQRSVLEFCEANGIELVIVGPEQPLADGLADYLRENGILVFGPDKDAAVIEGEKSFSKNLMKKYGIPTADFEIFDKEDYNKALSYIAQIAYPAVIKADGLAAGKGVLICANYNEAADALEDCFAKNIFGKAGAKIVIEEFMAGEEASIFAVTDGDNYITLPSAQDHKRIYDGDKGKNTGGMGAYSPAPVVTGDLLKEVEQKIIEPTLSALKKEGRKYNGCLYCGIMVTAQGAKVVEFNCRFGDPETQAVLPLLSGDLLELFYSAAKGKLKKDAVNYPGGASVCVVAASKGYPDSYEKGFEITGLENAPSPEVKIFHAGTKFEGDKIVTSGGRVLGVTAVLKENNLKLCKQNAYKALQNIKFDNIYYRTDIADKGIAKQK
jgi:phosphoribosylamine--glycine ligase